MRSTYFLLIADLLFVSAASCRQNISQPERPDHRDASASSSPPPTSVGQSCEPTFLKVSDEALVTWSGFWKIGFDVYLIGCKAELKAISSRERQLISERVQEKVRMSGRSFIIQQQEEKARANLAAELDSVIGRGRIKDVLMIIRYSIEHEPRQ
jgi:hypothetical protein